MGHMVPGVGLNIGQYPARFPASKLATRNCPFWAFISARLTLHGDFGSINPSEVLLGRNRSLLLVCSVEASAG